MDWILIGGALGLLASGVVLYATYLNNRSSSSKSSAILDGVTKGKAIGENTYSVVTSLVEENDKLKKDIEIQNEKINRQAAKIVELGETNVELSLRLSDKAVAIYDNLTGGNSMCYLNFSVNATTRLADVFLLQLGSISLPKIKVRIIDHQATEIFASKDYLTIREGEHFPLTKIQLKDETAHFSISFSAENGTWSQQVIIRREGTSNYSQKYFSTYSRLYKIAQPYIAETNYNYKLFEERKDGYIRSQPTAGYKPELWPDWKDYIYHCTPTGYLIAHIE